GTGYSSLSYLKRLPTQTIKIDQSFVRDILHDQDDLALTEAVIGLARAFGREVIAEGLESVEHGRVLMGLGCELAQGYSIARRMPASDGQGWAQAYRQPVQWRDP
ncbi:MAG TPA: GGDEF domain-containing protein, partial [Pseudomonas sp.]|nr:GGDEF domain-containing protein [Pseudomonas sp.]